MKGLVDQSKKSLALTYFLYRWMLPQPLRSPTWFDPSSVFWSTHPRLDRVNDNGSGDTASHLHWRLLKRPTIYAWKPGRPKVQNPLNMVEPVEMLKS